MTGPISNDSSSQGFKSEEDNLSKTPPPFSLKSKSDSAPSANTSSGGQSIAQEFTQEAGEKISSTNQLMQNPLFMKIFEQGVSTNVNQESQVSNAQIKKNLQNDEKGGN